MTDSTLALASTERLEALLQEAENELSALQPRIDELEAQIQELKKLKLEKQRLLTLKMSLSALLESSTKDNALDDTTSYELANSASHETKLYDFNELSTLKTFHPEAAFKQVDQILKQKNSLNYEMFKAVVFNGGKASTEQIKAYLVECGARQPQTGEGFEEVPLTEISSRANYLVRKGILRPMDRGMFYATLGWLDPQD